jgi:hypothetical protein
MRSGDATGRTPRTERGILCRPRARWRAGVVRCRRQPLRSELPSAAARWRPCASSPAARIPITQAARRRGSPGRRRAGSSVPTCQRTATTSTAWARTHAATRGCRCLGGPGRSPIRPCRISRPGSAPTRDSRRGHTVAQLADGISQLGMAPAHLSGDAAVGRGNGQVVRSSIASVIVQDRKVNLPRGRAGAQDPRLVPGGPGRPSGR